MAGKPPMQIDEMELYRSRLKAKKAAVEQAEDRKESNNERSLNTAWAAVEQAEDRKDSNNERSLNTARAAVEQAEDSKESNNERSLERHMDFLSKEVGIEFKTALRLNRVRAGSEADDEADEGKNYKKAMNALKDYIDATLETIKHPNLADHFKGDDKNMIEKAVQETRLLSLKRSATVGKLAEALSDLECIVEPILIAVHKRADGTHKRKRSIHEMGDPEFWMSPDLDAESDSAFNTAVADFFAPDSTADSKADSKADSPDTMGADTPDTMGAETEQEPEPKKLATIAFKGFSDSEAEGDTTTKWKAPHGFSPPHTPEPEEDTAKTETKADTDCAPDDRVWPQFPPPGWGDNPAYGPVEDLYSHLSDDDAKLVTAALSNRDLP